MVTTTISDYMNDFETFLVEFWAAKFAYTILEAVILSYIRVILFRKGVQNTPTTPSTPDTPVQKVGFFSSLMRKTAEISQKITNTGIVFVFNNQFVLLLLFCVAHSVCVLFYFSLVLAFGHEFCTKLNPLSFIPH